MHKYYCSGYGSGISYLTQRFCDISKEIDWKQYPLEPNYLVTILKTLMKTFAQTSIKTYKKLHQLFFSRVFCVILNGIFFLFLNHFQIDFISTLISKKIFNTKKQARPPGLQWNCKVIKFLVHIMFYKQINVYCYKNLVKIVLS